MSKGKIIVVERSESIMDLQRPVVCMGTAAYHIEEYFALQQILEEREGIPTVIISPVESRKFRLRQKSGYLRYQELLRFLPKTTKYSLEEILELVGRSSALIVKNDWRDFPTLLIDHARKNNIPTIGWVEGATHFELVLGLGRCPYRYVDNVFCLGDYDAEILGKKNNTIVGNQRLWELWRKPENNENLPLATVNSNFAYRKRRRVHNDWLKAVAGALENSNLAWKLSRHPAEIGSTFPYRAANESISDLLKQSTHLISQQSTVCYEALVRGVSLHFYNAMGDEARTFQDHEGGFTVSTTSDELKKSLSMSNLNPSMVRNNAKAFLEKRLSLECNKSPAERATSAIMALRA